MSELKRGVYQLQTGNKQVKVAKSIPSLKRKLKSPLAPSMLASLAGTGKVSLVNGSKFILYTSKNQKGIKLEVADGVAHETVGYFKKSAKGRVGGNSKIVRAKVKYLAS